MRKTSRGSKALIGSLLVIVFLLIRGTRQQRMLRLVMFGLWFPNPFGAAYDWITAGVQAIPDAIKEWVKGIIYAIGDVFIQMVQDTVNVFGHVFQMLADLSRDFEHIIRILYDTVVGWVHDAVAYVVAFIDTVAQAIFDYVNAGFHAVLGWIATAANAVAAVASNALSAAVDFLRTAIDNVAAFAVNLVAQAVQLARDGVAAVVDFLRALIDNVATFAEQLVAQAVRLAQDALTAAYNVIMALVGAATQALHDALFAALDTVRDEIFATVRAWVMDVIGPFQTVVDIVHDVADWLIGLALFPFTTARDMWESMRSSDGTEVLDGMKAAHGRWGDHISDHARNYVG